MNKLKEPKNPWTPDDEKGHFPSPIEWWSNEILLKDVKTKKEWNLKASFTEWCENKQKRIGCIYRTVLLDVETDKHFEYSFRSDSHRFESSEKHFDVRLKDSFMRGLYPKYEMKFVDPEHKIETHLNYHADVLPHWVSQDITNGYLPMGLGQYRYGYIPKISVTGTMKKDGETLEVEGKGYLEHVWGSFSYDNPFKKDSDLKKTVSTYVKLLRWWLCNNTIRIPKSITFSTENNPFSYDWIWGLLDNGWTVFYGNSLFWIMDGPATGSLIISKDEKTYTEFGNITFKYNKIRYVKKYDFYYPEELELFAKQGKEFLHLIFKNTTDYLEHINPFPYAKHWWTGFAICEAPGIIEGFYSNGERKTKLSGICRLEPQRQISKLGHNSLKLDFLKPPKGVGISVDFESHFFEKKIKASLQLAPSPKLKFNFQRIDRSKINKKIR